MHSNVGGGYPDDSAVLYLIRRDDLREAQTLRFEVQVGSAGPPPALPADPDTFKHADRNVRQGWPASTIRATVSAATTVTGRASPSISAMTDTAKPKTTRSDRATEDSRDGVLRRFASHADAYAGRPSAVAYRLRKDDGANHHARSVRVSRPRDAGGVADTRRSIWSEIWKRRIVYFAHCPRYALAARSSRCSAARCLPTSSQPDPLDLRYHPPGRRLPAGLRLDLDRRLCPRADPVLPARGLVTFFTLEGWIAARISDRHGHDPPAASRSAARVAGQLDLSASYQPALHRFSRRAEAARGRRPSLRCASPFIPGSRLPATCSTTSRTWRV